MDLSRLTFGSVSAGAILLALALSAPAGAALNLHASTRSEVADSLNQSVTAECPKGEAAVSGGFQLPDPFAQDNLLSSTASFRDGSDWTLATRFLAGNINEDSISSTAYCSPVGEQVTTRRAETDISGSASSQATASCRRSEAVVSGGYAVASGEDGGGFISRSTKTGKRGWTVSAEGNGSGTVTLVAFANCLPVGKAPTLKTRKETAPIPATSLGTFTADCKRGEHVISGGMRTDGTPFTFANLRETKRSWEIQSAGSGSTTVFAYCESR